MDVQPNRKRLGLLGSFYRRVYLHEPFGRHPDYLLVNSVRCLHPARAHHREHDSELFARRLSRLEGQNLAVAAHGFLELEPFWVEGWEVAHDVCVHVVRLMSRRL